MQSPLRHTDCARPQSGDQVHTPPHIIERARPLLGTIVSIAVMDDDAATAHAAINAAFSVVAHVHARMSFHEPDSDLSRLHRANPGTRVTVGADTAAVLRAALDLSARSDGVFDVTVGASLAARGLIPAPCAERADPDANWRDIVIDDDDGVQLCRRLWIDLGGIAKGHAVDRAIEVLRSRGIKSGIVNAGGDLRTFGAATHRVVIDVGVDADAHAVLELEEAAVATSSGRGFVAGMAPHLDGRCRSVMGRHTCVSVVAPCCLHADALTKPVLACGHAAAPLLHALGATAYLHDADGQWLRIGIES